MRKAVTVERLKAGGRYSWAVSYPAADGRRRRRYFRGRTEALFCASTLRQSVASHGREAGRVSAEERSALALWRARLADCGLSVAVALERAVTAEERTKGSIKVEDAVERLLDEKAQQHVSSRHLKDMRLRLGRLVETFRGRLVASIGGEELNAWLRSLGGSPRTQTGYRRHVSILWRFGAVRGWCEEAPLRLLSTPRPVDGAVDVFTVEETRSLLETADGETLPFLIFSLFGGLRSSEVERLRWEDVHRATKVIEVKTLKGRRSVRARFVPICPALERWLEVCGRDAGPVIPRPHSPDYVRHRLAQVRKAAGLANRSNAARHTFISARLAIEPDVAQVAAEAGNSVTVIQASYRRPLLRSIAEEYFAILPAPGGENVVSMAEAQA